MNKVMVMGRLTKDPEIRYAQSTNMMIANFSIAVDRRGKEKATDFFNCTAFGKLAEFAEKYLKKGTKVVTIGRLQNDTYTNRQGVKVTTTQIIADEIEFAEVKKQDEPKPEPKADEFLPMDGDEELPFNFD